MKKYILLSCAFLFIGATLTLAQTTKKETSAVKIEGYYFHMSTRCVTCKAVESEAKKDLEQLYGSKATFQTINLEEDASKVLADQFNISGQTLLIVIGDKKTNLTNEGFLYALKNPEKFKTALKQKVDGLLK